MLRVYVRALRPLWVDGAFGTKTQRIKGEIFVARLDDAHRWLAEGKAQPLAPLPAMPQQETRREEQRHG